MKTALKFFIIFTAVFFVVVQGSGLCVQPPKGEGPDGESGEPCMMEKGMHRFDMILKELDVTDEQMAKFEDNAAKARETGRNFRKDIKAKMDLLRIELAKTELDMDAIYAIQGEIKTLMAQKKDAMLEEMLKVREILGPEKFAQFQEAVENRRKQRFERRKEGREGGRGSGGWRSGSREKFTGEKPY